jgi:hypothetical protein
MAFDPVTAGLEVGKEVIGLFKRWFPEKMSEEQEAQITEVAQSSFRNFVVQYEGSASDYKDIKFFGPLMMMIRGIIRPAVTIAVVYFDSQYFTLIDATKVQWPEGTAQILLWMNVLVLGFWFGERAVKNSGIVESLGKFFKG